MRKTAINAANKINFKDRRDFLNIIENFKKIHVAIIGDAILDAFLFGRTLQLCREAPVPILESEYSRSSPGGAANAALNLANLGAHVNFISVIGEDRPGEELLKLLQEKSVNIDNCIIDKKRETLFKQRILAGSQMLLRLDKGTKGPLTKKSEDEIIKRLRKIVNDCEALIVSDYQYGVITPGIIQTISDIAHKNDLITAIDAKRLSPYKNVRAAFIKPNYREAIEILNLAPCSSSEQKVEQILHYGDQVREKINAAITAITLDEDGALIFCEGEKPYRTYAPLLEHPNMAGAGDTFMAAFVLAFTSGKNPFNAADIASAASNIAVSKRGATASCSLDELKGHFSAGNKQISSIEDLKTISAYYRSQGLKIVFTNGCFDIIHPGHIHFLEQSHSLGDVLIVGVNSDESIRKIKGPNRPINTIYDRIQILGSLNYVDHVIGFSGDFPADIIGALKPDIFVKGGNHKIDELPEVPLIKEQGGKVCILPYLRDYSTLELLQRINQEKINDIKNGPIPSEIPGALF